MMVISYQLSVVGCQRRQQNKKPHAGIDVGPRSKFSFPAGYLAFFKLVASDPKSIQRDHCTPIETSSQGPVFRRDLLVAPSRRT
jgi:hypothetical protein